MDDVIEPAPARDLHQQRVRMTEILRRHVRAEDKNISDCEFIAVVMERYIAALNLALIDPNE